jgi:hypothetical protein
MTAPRMSEGRVWLRLSDVPLKKRIEVAEKLSDQLIEEFHDEDSLLESSYLRAVAEDPERAAHDIPHQCVNRAFAVTVDQYNRVVLGKRKPRMKRAA